MIDICCKRYSVLIAVILINLFFTLSFKVIAADKVKVQLKWYHQFQFAGYYAAVEKGYYQDNDLDVTLIEHTKGSPPIDKLIRGTVNFVVADTGALVYRSTGVPLVALAAIFQHSPAILLTKSDSNIKKLSDLRHQPIMLYGGHMDAEQKAMLQHAGLNLNKLNLVPSNTSLDDLINNQVAAYNAYTTNEPYLLKQAGIGFNIFHPRDYGIDFYGDILLTTEKLISEQPDLVKRFREATLKGWEYAVKNPAEIIDLIISKYNSQKKSREHLIYEAEQSIDLIEPNVVPVGYMSEKRWHHIKEVFQKQGLLPLSFEMDNFIYQDKDFSQILLVFKQHLDLILMLGFSLIALLLLLHIISLKLIIRSKTSELTKAKDLAEKEARNDALTGLPNRRYFGECFSRNLSVAKRKKITMTLIAVDIDHFKSINDKFGHATGDEVLREVSQIFKAFIRTGDMAARIGGEEFVLMCFDSSLDETLNFAERLRKVIEQNIFSKASEPLKITCSFGIIASDMELSEKQLLSKADQALYKAKHRGRNQVCIWESNL